MNIEQLKDQLHSLGIAPDAYCLSGGLPNEKYVLGKEPNGQWGVYYSERGQKNGLRLFDSESSACSYLLEKITHDLGTGRR